VTVSACPRCGAQMPDTATFCPGCGYSGQAETRATGKVGLLSEPVAGALAYLTFLPAILFLVLAPYNGNRFVRFHSFQCLLSWAAGILIALVLKMATIVLFMIPVVGPLLVVLISTLIALGLVVLWVVVVVKALQGDFFKLPLIGEFAARTAGHP
jgi:uncharacterized membrane protein